MGGASSPTSSGWRWTACLCLWLALTALLAVAASAQVRDAGSHTIAGRWVDGAPMAAGNLEWYQVSRSHPSLRVAATCHGDQVSVKVALPARVGGDRAAAVSAALGALPGWKGVSLTNFGPHEGFVIESVVAGAISKRKSGRSTVFLDVPGLVGALGPAVTGPILLCVIVPEGEAAKSSGPPCARAAIRQREREYLFYRLGSGLTSAPLSIAYGVSHQWIAAAIGTVLLIVSGVLLVLGCAQMYLRWDSRLGAPERLLKYERWVRGVQFIPITCSYAVILAINASYAGPMLRASAPKVPAGLAVLFLALMSVGVHLIGLPLVRDAIPGGRDRSWRKAVFRTAFVAVRPFVAIFLLVVVAWRPLTGKPPLDALETTGWVVLGLTGFFGPVVWNAWRQQRRRMGWGTGDPEAAPELISLAQSLTSGLRCPVQRVVLERDLWFEPPIAPSVSGSAAVLSANLVRELETEQAAALAAGAAHRVAQSPSELWDRYRAYVRMLFPCMAAGVLTLAILHLQVGWPAPVIGFLVLLVTAVTSTNAISAYHNAEQDLADVRVTVLQGDPGPLLTALRRCEEILQADGEEEQRRVFALRRTRLEKQLALAATAAEAPAAAPPRA